MNAEPELRAELLSPAQLDERLAEASIVYVPLGALEFHGPHLPVGLDGLTAHGVCVAAAGISGGVVLPTVYHGTGGEHTRYPWTIMMPDGDAVAKNLMVTVERLSKLGAQTVVILSGHFADEQRAMLHGLSTDWLRDGAAHTKLVATTMADHDSSPVAPDHAGVFETLLLAALHPELVHLDRLPDPSQRPAADPGGDPFGAHRHDPSHALWGVFGPDPRRADLDEAAALLEASARWVAGLATEP
jgi:creatinine amidohydrolase